MGVSTDYPVFRLADVYLMAAEAVVRGGSGYSREEVLGFLNLIRQRAYGDVAIVFFTVIAVGWIAVWYPVRYMSRRLLSL